MASKLFSSSAEADVARRQSKILVERIQARMTHLETTAAETSRTAGLGQTAVYDIISGKNKNPSVPVVQAIARALHCTVAYLVGETDIASGEPERRRAVPIPVIGVAEAGAFREMAPFDVESEREFPTRDAPLSQWYPTARHFALQVRGDSMNAAAEGPIVEGMFVLCVDIESAALALETGKIYVVRRTLDHGQTYEITLKRARVYRDRIELVPESTNSRHQKIVLAPDFDADPAHEVKAIGLVYGAMMDFEHRP